MATQNPRLLALKALSQVLIEHKSLDEALAYTDQKDLSLIKYLSYGVLREYQSLEFILAQLLNKPLKTKEIELKIILLLGLFQLKNSRIAEHAAINETVNLTKLTQHEYASGLVNAILRRFTREKDNLLAQLTAENISEHPAWLLNKIKTSYQAHWQDIIKANNLQAPMHLRVNRRKTSKETYLNLLQQQGLSASLHPDFADAITLTNPIEVQALPHFNDGWVSVQDLAAQLAPYFLNLNAGQTVLDACAAPGGKTCHILEYADVNLMSMDISKSRLVLIEQNLTRLDLKAELYLGDASQVQNFAQSFDRILVDAPCSGTGVIRRHPDIKFLRQAADIKKLHELQVKIIIQLASYLKPKGLMLYATCSILPEENDLTIAEAIRNLKNFEVIPLNFNFSENITIKPTKYGLQYLPSPTMNDGFYYCLIKNNSLEV